MTDFAAARGAMVDCQVRPADVTRYAIIDAMLSVPRERFVPKTRRDIAYADCEVEMASGRMMLAPRTLGKMLEAAQIDASDLVLDLAAGTGYTTALVSRMAEAVVAIEADAAMVETATGLLADLEIDNGVVAVGDPVDGDPAHGPYDVIILNGAVEKVPESLTDQLKDGGRLVTIFMDGPVGQCRVLVRSGATVSHSIAFDATAPVLDGFHAERAFAF